MSISPRHIRLLLRGLTMLVSFLMENLNRQKRREKELLRNAEADELDQVAEEDEDEIPQGI